MAKPIKEMPILLGEDAALFMKRMKAAEESSVDIKERARIRKNFALLQAIASNCC